MAICVCVCGVSANSPLSLKFVMDLHACNSVHRSVQDRKEHLEAQLDSLLGRVVHGTLCVLRGYQYRLLGGMYCSMSV